MGDHLAALGRREVVDQRVVDHDPPGRAEAGHVGVGAGRPRWRRRPCRPRPPPPRPAWRAASTSLRTSPAGSLGEVGEQRRDHDRRERQENDREHDQADAEDQPPARDRALRISAQREHRQQRDASTARSPPPAASPRANRRSPGRPDRSRARAKADELERQRREQRQQHQSRADRGSDQHSPAPAITPLAIGPRGAFRPRDARPAAARSPSGTSTTTSDAAMPSQLCTDAKVRRPIDERLREVVAPPRPASPPAVDRAARARSSRRGRREDDHAERGECMLDGRVLGAIGSEFGSVSRSRRAEPSMNDTDRGPWTDSNIEARSPNDLLRAATRRSRRTARSWRACTSRRA